MTIDAVDVARISLFVAGTIASVVVSWRSLFNVRSHGFSRFFAWEAILALMALNLPHWISDPFSAKQLCSWALLITSMFPLVLGIAQLRKAKTADDRPDTEIYEFERTSELVSTGIYRYIRHPIYACLLYVAWGAFLKNVTWVSAVLVGFACLTLFATALADERECIDYFGAQYQDYMRRTKRFVPFLF